MNRIIGLFLFLVCFTTYGQNVFSVKGNKTYLNQKEFQVIGLRCSNALYSDHVTQDLIDHLDIYQHYGINTISVFFMGSRFGDIRGYQQDAGLDPVYAQRMAQIIEACDQRNIVVLVGCLYWGNSKGKWDNWTQAEANQAVANTVQWLSQHDYRNVLVDPDNEGMAHREKGFNISEMIAAGKKIDGDIVIGYNNHGYPPGNADLALHFARSSEFLPYIESEGTMSDYWGAYSKEDGVYHYINVGMYTEGKKQEQIANTQRILDRGHGYVFASTWLQNIPVNFKPGGDGSPCDPGIRWWLDYIRQNYKSK
ncbi:MAG: hypothetical protein ACNS62_19590 [Candidatus Cyclobacteriaceae bacterium M3_2C_046]